MSWAEWSCVLCSSASPFFFAQYVVSDVYHGTISQQKANMSFALGPRYIVNFNTLRVITVSILHNQQI